MASAPQAAKAAPPAAAPQSKLAAVRRGIVHAPNRYLFYGAEGTGKSTLAAAAPDPIFLDADGGSGWLDTSRYPFYPGQPDEFQPRSYDDILAAVHDLTVSPHKFRTLVLDTGDKIEALLWAWMIKRDNDPSVMKRENPLHQIEDYGYAKGYGRAVDVWRDLCVRLDHLRMKRSMEVVILAHEHVRNFKNPDGPDYDRFTSVLDPRAFGFLKGWCDFVGRVCHEETAEKLEEEKKGKAKGLATGTRLIRLTHSAAFDAKARGNLPDEVEMPREDPWGPLAAAISDGLETDVAKLKKEIRAELSRIGDAELSVKALAAADAAEEKKDVTTLITYLNNLKKRPAKSAESK